MYFKIKPYLLILSLLLSCFSVISWAQNESEFKSVSPFMLDDSDQASASFSLPLSDGLVQDPYEEVNRKVFTFNDTLDTYFLVPVATFYNKVMPKPLNKGIYNIFSNLNNVPTVGNDVLQGNFYQATSDSWRFLINSTAGVGGMFDLASNMGLDANSEDFGLTLARWGYHDSSYLVLPFFGPSTVRDALGLPVDYSLFSPYNLIPGSRAQYTLYALNILSKRAYLLQYQDLYNQIALDRYVFIRNAYLQQRRNAIERNQGLSDPYFNLTMRK